MTLSAHLIFIKGLCMSQEVFTSRAPSNMPAPFKRPDTPAELHQLQRETTALLHEQRLVVAKNKLTRGAKSEGQREIMLSRYTSDKAIIEAAGGVSYATKVTYLRLGLSLVQRARAQQRDFWSFAEERVSNKDSWYATKAALQFYLASEVQLAKSTIDVWLRGDHRQVHSPESLPEGNRDLEQAVNTLVEMANALAATPHGQPPDKFAGPQVKSQSASRSKSRSILRRPPDWRERLAEKVSLKHRLLFCIQCVAGCRPAELKLGAVVVLRADGDIELTTPGAKRGKYAGQERRQLVVSAHSGIAKMLADMLEVNSPVRAGDVLTGTVDAYRAAVSLAGRKAFPKDKAWHCLTAYSARHQFRADLRAAGLSREDTAKALGHATTRSATYYARGGRAGSGRVAPKSVEASRPVKQRSPYPKMRANAAKPVASQAAPAARRRKVKP